MSGRRARILRRQIYCADGMPKHGVYVKHPKKGVVLADMKRHDYQEAKRRWRQS